MPNPNLPNQAGYNTYVGARYVPVFSEVNNGVWTNTVEYEPLTIVMYNGNSYTSKTYVPVGIDINNTTYWAPTGNYNAQIEQYRQETQTALNTANLARAMQGRRIIIITDSYGQTSEGQPGWPYLLKTIAGLDTDACYIADKGSQGFAAGDTKFLGLLQSITASDPETITDIIVGGGYNDSFIVSGILTGIQQFIEYALTTYPNAKVHIGMISRADTLTEINNLLSVMNTYKSGSVRYGGSYLNGVEYLLQNSSLLLPDGFHPNYEGNHTLAIGILNSLITGNCSRNNFFNQTLKTTNGTLNVGNYFAGEDYNSAIISIPAINIEFDPAITLKFDGTALTGITVPQFFGNPTITQNVSIECMCILTLESGEYLIPTKCIAVLKFDDNTLHIEFKFFELNESKNGYLESAQVKKAVFYNLYFFYPKWY